MTKSNSKAIFALSMGHFTADLYASALVPLYPVIISKLNITLGTISLIISLGHLTSSMLQPLFGLFADKMKKRAFMINGLLLGAVFIPLTILAPNTFLLALFLMIVMCGNSLFHPQVTSLVKTFCYNNPDVTKFMGLFMGLGTIGYALGPVVSSGMVSNFGDLSLTYITFIGVICAISLYFAVPKIPTKSVDKTKENFFEVMKSIISNKTCMLLVFIAVVKSAVSISFGTYIPFILKDYGFNLNQTGFIVTTFYLLSGVSMILSSKLEKIIGPANLIRLSFFSMLPLVLLFKFLSNININLGILVFILSGLFIYLSVSVTIVAAQKLIPKHQGVISGVMQGFSWGIGAMTLAPMGYIGENFGIFWILFIMAVFAFLSGIFCLTEDVRKVLE